MGVWYRKPSRGDRGPAWDMSDDHRIAGGPLLLVGDDVRLPYARAN